MASVANGCHSDSPVAAKLSYVEMCRASSVQQRDTKTVTSNHSCCCCIMRSSHFSLNCLLALFFFIFILFFFSLSLSLLFCGALSSKSAYPANTVVGRSFLYSIVYPCLTLASEPCRGNAFDAWSPRQAGTALGPFLDQNWNRMESG